MVSLKEPTMPKASNPPFAGQTVVSDSSSIVFCQAAVGNSLGWLVEDSLDPWFAALMIMEYQGIQYTEVFIFTVSVLN